MRLELRKKRDFVLLIPFLGSSESQRILVVCFTFFTAVLICEMEKIFEELHTYLHLKSRVPYFLCF